MGDKPTFKQFAHTFLDETLRVDTKTNEVIFTTQSTKFDRNQYEIDTYIGRGDPHKEESPKSGNVKIFSIYLYLSRNTEGPGNVVTNLLKSLKGDGPYSVSQKTMNSFLGATAKRSIQFIKDKNIDTVIYPKSNSKFLQTYIDHIKSGLGDSVKVIPDAIVKKQIHDLNKIDVSKFINMDDPRIANLSTAHIEQLKKSVINNIKKNAAAGKGNIISVKDIFKPHSKFVTNFMELAGEVGSELEGKNVLIIDDVLSSGATFAEMARLVKNENVKNLMGLTIFKRTNSSQRKD